MENANLKELQEVNKKLYASMKAFQIAAEESGSLVFTYDTQTQTIFVDEQTARQFGVREIQQGVPYEMLKMGIVSEDTQAEYLRLHEAMIRGAKEARGVVKLIQADGTETVQELKFRSILDAKGIPTGIAVGVYRDITERYAKELEEERYRQIVFALERYNFHYDSRTDLLVVFAPSGQGEAGEARYEHPGFLAKLRKGEICSRGDLLVLEELFIHGSQKPVQVELFSVKTKEKRWYAMTANVTESKEKGRQVFGLISDITDIKEKERSYQKLERVLRGMRNDYKGIFEIDLQSDTFLVLYDELEDTSFVPKEGCYSQMISLTAEKLVAPEFRESFEQMTGIEYLKSALKEEQHIELEYRTNMENGAWRRNTYQVVEYKDGKPYMVVMYHSDIDKLKTKLLTQQQAIQAAYEYAESANAAKTDFLSRMSHDIRTPINAIIGMTAIAGNNLDNPDRVGECLGKISAASKHLLSLINEVLDMTKIESGAVELQEEKFNLADLIENMITMVLPQIKQHNHQLEVSIGNLKHEWVVGDSLRIQQAFVNLISNAVKYTPDGGRIEVSIKERSSHSQNFGEYEFCFEDNGIGMSKEFQEVLFEPFSRAEDSRVSKVTGTGLGMSITRNLIRMMDGEIQVDSQLNKGTRFIVTIHLKLEEDGTEIQEELENLPVLVVDDDESTCESTCILLKDIGMIGESCLSGREAVELVRERRQRGEDYFAVLLDWKMPGMDGVTTAREIGKVVGQDVPIIFLTAYDWSEIETEAETVGVDRFLSKPLFKSRLVNSFKGLINPAQEKDNGIDGFSEDVTFSNKRILLAEDNELNAEIATELLEMLEISVDWVENGREAVETVENSEEGYYDLILMDVQMPVLDGYGATSTIRKLNRKDAKKIPIVAMTANAFAEDVNDALNAGMTEHIAKPVDLKQLEKVLRRYLCRQG